MTPAEEADVRADERQRCIEVVQAIRTLLPDHESSLLLDAIAHILGRLGESPPATLAEVAAPATQIVRVLQKWRERPENRCTQPPETPRGDGKGA